MTQKEIYSTPECESIQLKLERVIAASPTYSTSPANPFSGDTEEDW